MYWEKSECSEQLCGKYPLNSLITPIIRLSQLTYIDTRYNFLDFEIMLLLKF